MDPPWTALPNQPQRFQFLEGIDCLLALSADFAKLAKEYRSAVGGSNRSSPIAKAAAKTWTKARADAQRSRDAELRRRVARLKADCHAREANLQTALLVADEADKKAAMLEIARTGATSGRCLRRICCACTTVCGGAGLESQ